ncbi:MAG: thiamine-binding protein [Anaerolineae bacterium]|nr:thiamine-binding protein [Anaerolineae bacterium]
MSIISAQVSLYPLRQADIGPGIREAVRVFREHGLTVRYGAMSTLVWGENHLVFVALEDAFQRAAALGDAVMTVTFSNACPLPEES